MVAAVVMHGITHAESWLEPSRSSSCEAIEEVVGVALEACQLFRRTSMARHVEHTRKVPQMTGLGTVVSSSAGRSSI